MDYSGSRLRAPKKRLWSSHVRVSLDRREATFDGRGHGHGVGLCQYGAEALAQAGEDHESIVQWYYPGAALLRTYA